MRGGKCDPDTSHGLGAAGWTTAQGLAGESGIQVLIIRWPWEQFLFRSLQQVATQGKSIFAATMREEAVKTDLLEAGR